jgi:hypothetical protein
MENPARTAVINGHSAQRIRSVSGRGPEKQLSRTQLFFPIQEDSMTRRIFVAIFLSLTAVVASAQAAGSASATASAFAKVITPIAITKTADLNFGTIISGPAGTVTVSPAGVETASGATVLNPNPNVSAALFSVTGEPSTAYSISLPSSISITNGAQSMTVSSFTSNPTPGGVLSAGGSQALQVGATLAVATNQAIGSYSGTFSVTVAY